jgi:hypothetical protein
MLPSAPMPDMGPAIPRWMLAGPLLGVGGASRSLKYHAEDAYFPAADWGPLWQKSLPGTYELAQGDYHP